MQQVSKLCAVFLMCGMSAFADNVTEKEAASFERLSTFFADNYEKQVPRQYWEEALADYPDMEDSIVKFLRSKLGPDPDEKDKKRAIDAALRRGHNYSQIRRAMNSLELDQEDFLEEY